jgi:RHS repeat-associated protein
MCFCAAAAAQTKTVTYYYTDQVGSVLATTDSQGNILSSSDYRPFGESVMDSPSDGPAYTGHVRDGESNFTYMQARFYDPQVGRFLSPDPLRPSSGNLFDANRFAYVNNNPIRYSDPSGKCIWDACVAETYVAGIIIAAGATGDA